MGKVHFAFEKLYSPRCCKGVVCYKIRREKQNKKKRKVFPPGKKDFPGSF